MEFGPWIRVDGRAVAAPNLRVLGFERYVARENGTEDYQLGAIGGAAESFELA
jgi:hypothetical protein